MLQLHILITPILLLLKFLPPVLCQPQMPANSFDPYSGSQGSQQAQVGNADGYAQTYGNQMQIHQPQVPLAPIDPQGGYGHPSQQQPQWNQSQQQNQWGGGSGGEWGVDVTVQLRSYANPLQRVDQNGNLCVCPKIGTSNPNAYQHCIDVNPSRRDTCLVSFMVLVSADGGPTQYHSTPFIPLNSNGQVGAENLHVLQQSLEFHLNGQPGSVDVLVHSLGAVISPYTGDIVQSNTLSHVDSFSKSLNDSSYVPAAPSLGGSYRGGAYSGGPQHTLSGSLLGTQLTVSLSVSCRGRLLGPACDLACNTSFINSQAAICVSTKTGYFSLCRWASGNNQVSDCQSCPWGIRENAYCRDENGGVLDTQNAGVVSENFRTSTIVLAVLSALLLLCLFGTCIHTCRNPSKRQQPAAASGARSAPGYNSGYRSHTGDAETTALNSSGNHLNGALKGGGTNSALMPAAAPRAVSYIPSSLNRPRRTPLLYQLPPPAHLGGTISLNDTLNTSFAGSQAPLAPSVSADV